MDGFLKVDFELGSFWYRGNRVYNTV